MEGIEYTNNHNERVKLLNKALEDFKHHRLHDAVYCLNKAGEIELRDKVMEVEALECIQSILADSRKLESDLAFDIKSYIRSSITHHPYNVCIIAEKYGVLNRTYYQALMKIVAVAFEYSGDSLFNASRIYKSLGNDVKAGELLKIARDMEARDAYPTEKEQDEMLLRNKSVMIEAMRVFRDEVGDNPIMMIDWEKALEDVKASIVQKIASK